MSQIRVGFVVALVLAGALGACGSDGADAPPGVATLQSTAPVASASTRPVDDRPVVRLDATEADVEALKRTWVACLVKEGGPRYEDSGDLYLKGVIEDDPVLRACLHQQPEPYDQHQKRVDLAGFRDNQHEFYRCAKAEGYRLTPQDPETGEFGLTEIGPDGDFGSPKIEECKRQAFSE